MNPRSQSEMPRSLLSNGQKNVTAILALVESVEHPLQVKIPAQQWTEEHRSHPCSGRVCGPLHPGQDPCSAMDRRALQSFWLYVEQPAQAHRPEIDHILVHKQVHDKLKYLKYYKICSPTITELNSK